MRLRRAYFACMSVCLLACTLPTETSCFVSTSRNPTHGGPSYNKKYSTRAVRTSSSPTSLVVMEIGQVNENEDTKSASYIHRQKRQMHHAVSTLAASILLASSVLLGDVNANNPSNPFFSAPPAMAAEPVKTATPAATAAAPTKTEPVKTATPPSPITTTKTPTKTLAELSPVEARMKLPGLKAKIRDLKKESVKVNSQARSDNRELSSSELSVKGAKKELEFAVNNEKRIKAEGVSATTTATTSTRKPPKSPIKQKEDEELAKTRVDNAKDALKASEKRLADAKVKASKSAKAVATNKSDLAKAQDKLKKTQQIVGERLYMFETIAPWALGIGFIQWYRTSREDDMFGDDGGRFEFGRGENRRLPLLPPQYNDRDDYNSNGPYFRPNRMGRGGPLSTRVDYNYNDRFSGVDDSSYRGTVRGAGQRVRLSDIGKNTRNDEVADPYRGGDISGPSRPRVRLSDIGRDGRNSEYDDPYRKEDMGGPSRPRVRLSDIGKDSRNSEYDDPYRREDISGPRRPTMRLGDRFSRNNEFDDPYRRDDISGPRRPNMPLNDGRDDYRFSRNSEFDDPYRREDISGPRRPTVPLNDGRDEYRRNWEYDDPYRREDISGPRRPTMPFSDRDEYGPRNELEDQYGRDSDRYVDRDQFPMNDEDDRYDYRRQYDDNDSTAPPPRRRPPPRSRPDGQQRSEDRWGSSVSPWD